MKLLIMTEEGRQKLREKQQQRESKRRPGLTLEEVLAAMAEVDAQEIPLQHGIRFEFEASPDSLAHIKEGKNV